MLADRNYYGNKVVSTGPGGWKIRKYMWHQYANMGVRLAEEITGLSA